MCESRAPDNGADSERYELKHYRVLMCDTFAPDDGRFWVDIPTAMGPHDAANQARELKPGHSALKSEEVIPEEATFEEWLDWAGVPKDAA